MPTIVKYRTAPIAWESQSENSSTRSSFPLAITREPDLLAIILLSLVALWIAICLVRFLPLSVDAAAFLASAT